jgi:hypothetical protein
MAVPESGRRDERNQRGLFVQRRELLRLLSGALAVPALAGLSADELLALGQRLHAMGGGAGQQRRVLSEEQDRAVTMLAERIIPATDTPGATAARVNEFIDLILAEWYSDEDRDRFLAGLRDLDARGRDRFGVSFADADAAQQTVLLAELDDEVARLRHEDRRPEDHFFHQAKWLTLYGYYTSRVGVEQELRWVAIPGGYDPCREMSLRGAVPGERAALWAARRSEPQAPGGG